MKAGGKTMFYIIGFYTAAMAAVILLFLFIRSMEIINRYEDYMLHSGCAHKKELENMKEQLQMISCSDKELKELSLKTGCKLETKKEFYQPAGGRLKSIYTLADGAKHGEERIFHSDGSLAQIKNWTQGILNGWSINYTETGEIYFKTFYINGIPQMPYTPKTDDTDAWEEYLEAECASNDGRFAAKLKNSAENCKYAFRLFAAKYFIRIPKEIQCRIRKFYKTYILQEYLKYL